MLSFLLTIYLAFAFNPYVRTLRKPHQATGTAAAAQPNPLFYDYDFGDMIEDYMPFVSGGLAGLSAGASAVQGGAAASPFSSFMTPYMNNPYRMNMQKCMDNDACTSWVAHQMYRGIGGSAPAAPAAKGTDAGADAGTDAAASGADGAAAGGASAATTTGFTPAMLGFPAGFNPAYYGLDWDARPVDCMDDSKCARGLMMFTSGRSMGNSIGGAFAQYFMPSRLQRPRRLSRPRYGVPYRYGRQY